MLTPSIQTTFTKIATAPDTASVDHSFGLLFSPHVKIRQAYKTTTYDTFCKAFHDLQQGFENIKVNYQSSIAKEDERCLAVYGSVTFNKKVDPKKEVMVERFMAIMRFGEVGSPDERKIVEWDEVAIFEA